MTKPGAVALFTQDAELIAALEPLRFEGEALRLNPTSLDEHTLVVADAQKLLTPTELLKTVPASLVYWIGRGSDAEHVELIEASGLNHLLGYDLQRTPHELSLVLRRVATTKPWGLAPYLDPGVMPDGFSISESKREASKISELLVQQDWSEFFDSPVEHLNLVANELVSNALYNGPEEKRTHTDYPIDRRVPVFLKGSELVQVSLGVDSKLAALSVADCFGTLDRHKTIKSLARSFREKTVENKKGGAGLGLYLAFASANQFIVNRKPGLRTEVICIIEKNRRYKNYKQRIKSFHFYEEA